ncbi:MAG: apolipoprotein N-acyltransferase, partial [Pseudomonadota bacterium]
LNQKAKLENTNLLVGIPVQAKNQFFYYNAMLGLGEAKGRYYKRHLVPFGEYTPFMSILGNLLKIFHLPLANMIDGPLQQKLITVNGDRVGILICYEIAFANIVRADLPAANFLVAISDDAWFGKSFAPAQHLQIAQFRARQSGREMLFCANNGITAIINAKGQITKALPQFVRGVLSGEIHARSGVTPWIYYGNLPILALLGILLLILILFRSKQPSLNLKQPQ